MMIRCSLFKLKKSVSIVSLKMLWYLYLKIYRVNKLYGKAYKTQ